MRLCTIRLKYERDKNPMQMRSLVCDNIWSSVCIELCAKERQNEYTPFQHSNVRTHSLARTPHTVQRTRTPIHSFAPISIFVRCIQRCTANRYNSHEAIAHFSVCASVQYSTCLQSTLLIERFKLSFNIYAPSGQ